MAKNETEVLDTAATESEQAVATPAEKYDFTK